MEDKNTGMPEIPWPNHFWRVAQGKKDYYYGTKPYKVKLMKRVFGVFSVTVKETTTRLNPDRIYKDAEWVLRLRRDELAEIETAAAKAKLLGDYPPKRLERK